jgi:hypothetical protein
MDVIVTTVVASTTGAVQKVMTIGVDDCGVLPLIGAGAFGDDAAA